MAEGGGRAAREQAAWEADQAAKAHDRMLEEEAKWKAGQQERDERAADNAARNREAARRSG